MSNKWPTAEIGNICTVIAGQSLAGKFYNKNGNGLPFYQGKKEFRKRTIGNPTTWTSVTTKEAFIDDILMSVRAPVGPVNFSTQKICIGRGLVAIRVGKSIHKDYLFYFLQKHESEIIGNSGAVFNSINKKQIESIKLPLPSLPEQKHAIHDHFNQLRYFIDGKKFSEMKRFELKPGDIIMSCSGLTLGKVAITPENIPREIINQAVLKLTPVKDVSVNFLKYWLRSKIFQDIIFKYSGGAAIPNVPSAKILKEIVIPIPPYERQCNVVKEITLMLSEYKMLETFLKKKLKNLVELKHSILRKAFEGEF